MAEARFAGRTVAAVLFDMDGLLFDTERLFFRAMEAAGKERGLRVTRDFYVRLLGNPRETNWQLIRDEFGSAVDPEAFHDRCHVHMDGLVETGLRLKAGATELLDSAARLGLACGLVTSSAHRCVERNLAAFGLAGRFAAVVAHGDTASGKPHPAPYLEAAARLGAQPQQCLALEDSHNGVRSAAAAGAVTVMVPDLLEPAADIRALCTLIAPDLHAVAAQLRPAQS
ncbi:HAD family phosphatase [Erythrobacteraceae bacterium CFH 75059]|uniref:HAD family hydrolase n=1 Tax=Qipengyuania thermophila TaxID=2509361 RepID=UPI00102117C0|nr:HAD family phosphatase [Qipengyuania thermophila]TCD06514.1 HAD family phosphatase [Erythrobacteraceae bacterium CFH 75059]